MTRSTRPDAFRLPDFLLTSPTLNIGAKRFTYRIDIVDIVAGQLAIDVICDESPAASD